MSIYAYVDEVLSEYKSRLTPKKLYKMTPQLGSISGGMLYGGYIVDDEGLKTRIFIPESAYSSEGCWILCDENGLEVENSGWTEERLREV